MGGFVRNVAPAMGMRELLYPAATHMESLRSRLLQRFQLHGYQLVELPPFERAEVMEQGLNPERRRGVLRFVEPASGDVLMLTPDATPQAARLVATRLKHLPSPWRVAYRSAVIRREAGRARVRTLVDQVGVECVGVDRCTAEAGVIHLAVESLRGVGLTGGVVELRHVGFARGLLALIPDGVRPQAATALGQKDLATLEGLVAGRVPESTLMLLRSAATNYGDTAVLDQVLAAPHRDLPDVSLASLKTLREVAELVRGCDMDVTVDLGETRGMDYYTGVSFVILSDGPGQPVVTGGRYDDLVGRFGEPAPAVGFAVNVGELRWALSDSKALPERPGMVRFVASSDMPQDVLDALRDEGISVFCCAVDPVGYAGAWDFDGSLVLEDGEVVVHLRHAPERRLTASAQGKSVAEALRPLLGE